MIRWSSCLVLVAACASTPSGNVGEFNAGAMQAYLGAPPAEGRAEGTFLGSDGRELAFAGHRARGGKADTALVCLNGLAGHSGWFQFAARELNARGIDVFCLDRRGSGINRENRGFDSGHIDRYEILLDDLHRFAGALEPYYVRLYVVGLSWGGRLALGCALERPGDFDGIALVPPDLRSPPDLKSGEIPIPEERLTTHERALEYFKEDLLRLRSITGGFVAQSRALQERIDKEIGEIRTPILLITAGRDALVDNEAAKALVRRNPGIVEILVYEEQLHAIALDAPDRLAGDLARWIRADRARSGN
ncbi:MAG: alpha/beta hydrolase [Planctomycetota bacterium]|jgi:pimeloyl-ACP methyl ester carboxylesterase